MEYVVNGNKIVVADGSSVDFSNPKSIIINDKGICIENKTNLEDVDGQFLHTEIEDLEYGNVAENCRIAFKHSVINQKAIIKSNSVNAIRSALYTLGLACSLEKTDKKGYYLVTTKSIRRKTTKR